MRQLTEDDGSELNMETVVRNLKAYFLRQGLRWNDQGYEEFLSEHLLVKPTNQKDDEILRPPHYTHGRAFETLHVIEDWNLDKDYYLGNAIKYISRYNRKGSVDDPLSCLKKAIFYLQRKVDRMEGKM